MHLIIFFFHEGEFKLLLLLEEAVLDSVQEFAEVD